MEDLFSGFNKFTTVALSVNTLIWSIPVFVANQPIVDGCCMLNHPGEDRMIIWDPRAKVSLECSLLSPE